MPRSDRKESIPQRFIIDEPAPAECVPEHSTLDSGCAVTPARKWSRVVWCARAASTRAASTRAAYRQAAPDAGCRRGSRFQSWRPMSADAAGSSPRASFPAACADRGDRCGTVTLSLLFDRMPRSILTRLSLCRECVLSSAAPVFMPGTAFVFDSHGRTSRGFAESAARSSQSSRIRFSRVLSRQAICQIEIPLGRFLIDGAARKTRAGLDGRKS